MTENKNFITDIISSSVLTQNLHNFEWLFNDKEYEEAQRIIQEKEKGEGRPDAERPEGRSPQEDQLTERQRKDLDQRLAKRESR